MSGFFLFGILYAEENNTTNYQVVASSSYDRRIL